ncbi:hypothetical protein [Dysgonomonas macrotermitis]|uniref:Uncharacterized protein n=1 Tax=Dysgonomonas macrotermitis TaxID=1346286 RepID=A0A1M5C2L6_9BACT|nr:hypothetical protein [Dysgonomonas macrotermitis]SHF48905.1 hypothetical protein SAMN05444362_1075 [Dysgonomonas macrotermitis]SHG32233.1 hypothetical protein SAMN05444362_12130 [Dysgonomonas macrotermitis]
METIDFLIYPEIDGNTAKAQAIIENGKCVSYKLLFKSPRRFYYSFINDADEAFREQYPEYY